MTSNLGAAEMEALRSPRFGFSASPAALADQPIPEGQEDAAKTSRIGVEAARRKFTPEFMNRIDRMVVFKSLGHDELRRILGIELGRLQQRILSSSSGMPFVIALTEAAKDHVLCEGTDARYGARHLKRALDRTLVYPLSNLIASNQVRQGDWLTVDFDPKTSQMTFTKEAEDLPAYTMLKMAEVPASPSVALTAAMNADAPDAAVPSCGAPARRKERNLAA
jgi:ATP-dependent Clp protease ATP-binding subunit ClpA